MDFYDKLITCIVLIVVTFLCVFNTFCFADTDITLSVIQKSQINNDFQIVSHPGYNTFYFSALPNHTYQIICNYPFYLGYSSDVPEIGTKLDKLLTYNEDKTEFIFTNSTLSNVFLSSYRGYSDVQFNVIDITSPGFPIVISSLIQDVGISNIWDTFNIAIPYVLIVVVVGFGFYMILSLVRKLQKGKARL